MLKKKKKPWHIVGTQYKMMIIAVLWVLGVFQPQGQRGKKHRMQMWMKMHQMSPGWRER